MADNIDLNKIELHKAIFFNNIIKNLDPDVTKKIEPKFNEIFDWFLKHDEYDADTFSHELLSYLLFLNDNNVLDQISADTLEMYFPGCNYTPHILQVHLLLSFPDLLYQYDIGTYYMISSAYISDTTKLARVANERFKLIVNGLRLVFHGINFLKDLDRTYGNRDKCLMMACYLYHATEYSMEDINNTFSYIVDNLNEYVDYLSMNGYDKNLELDKMEELFKSVIDSKINKKANII